MEGWREIIQTPGLKLPKNVPPVQAGKPPPKRITAMKFDDSHDLLWIGDSDGYLYSFCGIKLVPYTSVRAHIGPVLKISPHKKGIITISSDSIRLGTIEGVCKYLIKDPNYNGFLCMSYTSNTQTELLVGGTAAGLHNQILKVDIINGKISGSIPYDKDVLLMDTNLKYVVLGRVDGSIDILDPKLSSFVTSFKCHSAGLSSICVKENVVLTTGYSLRRDQYVPDPMVISIDLKNLTPSPPVSFPAGASQVFLHPRLTTVSVITSNMGQINFIDIYNPGKLQLYQADLTSFLTMSDLSTSGDCLAFVDAMQTLHLWSNSQINSTNPPSFTVYSTRLQYPTISTEVIPAGNRVEFDSDTPLNSIKLPHYSTTLLSAWPSDMIFKVGTLPEQNDPELLRSSKSLEGFLIARYDKSKYGPRNVHKKYEKLNGKKSGTNNVPMFISERDDDEVSEKKIEREEKLSRDAFIDTSPIGDVPNVFKKVDILYSKFGIDDFDFDFYNKTPYSGLETNAENSYSNCLLQLYRFTPAIFNFVIKTLAEDVMYDDFVLTELGYLFDMLVKASGRHCITSNFQRLVCSLPDVQRLGLLNNEGKTKNDIAQRRLVHTFNRFLLEKLALDEKALYNAPVSNHFDSIAGVLTETALSSMYCELSHKRTTIFHSIDINTTPPVPMIPTHITILNYMEASMNKIATHPISCDVCKTNHPVDATLRIGQLPPTVVINLDLSNEQTNEVRMLNEWLVPEFYSAVSPMGTPILRTNAVAGNMAGLQKYELLGYVAQITSRDNSNHLVTIVKINDSNNGDPNGFKWYLFNDFLVTTIKEEEVFNLTHWWKRPVVVIYQETSISKQPFDYSSWKQNLNDSILYRDHFAKGTREGKIIEYELLTKGEAPKPGTVVAIDAEFVQLDPPEYEFNSKGFKSLVKPKRMSLARISVLRGEGPQEGVCFIDDYIVTNEKIDDYVTSYSGIEPGNLNPETSQKTLVNLQTAYRKMWLLLNLGCIFVGHSLGGDFRTINIQVPPSQVRDTAEFFYLKEEKRKLGLKFLIYHLFNERVQTGNHDSIEDAHSALKLYKRYLELKSSGQLPDTLIRIYIEGQFTRFKVPDN